MTCLSYPGAKQKAIKKLLPYLPGNPVETYREPFCGGASMFFALKAAGFAKNYLINDKYSDLINFWLSVRDCPMNLTYDLTLTKKRVMNVPELGAILFKDAQTALKTLPCPSGLSWERAVMFFYLSRCSFGATITAGGFSNERFQHRFTQSSINKIHKASELLQDTTIMNQDFEPIIENPGRDVFLYLDPPYMTAKRLYGPKGELHQFDHLRLMDRLSRTKRRFMLSYDDCEDVRQLYRWANIKEIDVPYSLNSHHPQKELVIRNYGD